MSKNQNLQPWLRAATFAFTMLIMISAVSYPAKAQQSTDATASISAARAKLLLKLKSITVSVNFDKADIATVLDFLSKKSKELDPDKEGINFVLQLPDDSAKSSDTSTPRPKIHREISMTLDNIPLLDLLQEISQQTNLQFSVEDYAVFLHPLK